jgi:hypothetical protein
LKNWYSVFYIPTENCYVFETDYGISYEIRLQTRSELISAYPHINLNVFEFSFAPANNAVPVSDDRIEPTIIHFLSVYFGKQTNALVVVYESLDGRHNARHLLFSKWLNRHTSENYLERVGFAIHMDESLDIKGLFLFRADHPQHDEILKIVDSIIKDMQSLK